MQNQRALKYEGGSWPLSILPHIKHIKPHPTLIIADYLCRPKLHNVLGQFSMLTKRS